MICFTSRAEFSKCFSSMVLKLCLKSSKSVTSHIGAFSLARKLKNKSYSLCYSCCLYCIIFLVLSSNNRKRHVSTWKSQVLGLEAVIFLTITSHWNLRHHLILCRWLSLRPLSCALNVTSWGRGNTKPANRLKQLVWFQQLPWPPKIWDRYTSSDSVGFGYHQVIIYDWTIIKYVHVHFNNCMIHDKQTHWVQWKKLGLTVHNFQF